MPRSSKHSDSGDFSRYDSRGRTVVFAVLLGALMTSVFLIRLPWALFHAGLLLVAGLLVAMFPPRFGIPRAGWIMLGIFGLLGSGWLLPAAWFGIPEWRGTLADLGVNVGDRVVIQTQHAVETLVMQLLALLFLLWLAGHRASSEVRQRVALSFCVATALYAVASYWLQEHAVTGEHFGLFPNRNHSATLLAMGTACGFGCILQLGRNKRFFLLGLAILATALATWALISWSISRAGVVLVVIGLFLWLPLLGRRYLGRHGLWAAFLLVLGAAGVFLMAQSQVKDRIQSTFNEAGEKLLRDDGLSQTESQATPNLTNIDFRIPMFHDTAKLIRDFPLTGIGAGQFEYVFPQYRHYTAIMQGTEVLHPESNWLWFAAEYGLPATAVLLISLVLAFAVAARGLFRGRDRALRASCLVAAALLPIHGFFDVPVNRLTLVWLSALLFVLSLHIPESEEKPRTLRLLQRLLAIPFLLTACACFANWYSGMPGMATTLNESVLAESARLEKLDQEKMEAARQAGIEYQPVPEEDPIEHALKAITAAHMKLPLNGRLYTYEAYYAMFYKNKLERIDNAYTIESALDPTSIQTPLLQAASIALVDPSQALPMFNKALLRSEKIQLLDPRNRWNRERTLEEIRDISRRHPELAEAASHVLPKKDSQ